MFNSAHLRPLSVGSYFALACCVAGWPSSGEQSASEKLRPRQSSQTIFESALYTQLQASHLPAEALAYTTGNGQPYATPFAAQRIGNDGPLLLQDTHLIDNQAHFNRERIPERIVHALGGKKKNTVFSTNPVACYNLLPTSSLVAGAHGFFTTTTDFASRYTMMSLFQKVGQTTPVTMRFSNAAGPKGATDTVRNVSNSKRQLGSDYEQLSDLFPSRPGKVPFTHSRLDRKFTNGPTGSGWNFVGHLEIVSSWYGELDSYKQLAHVGYSDYLGTNPEALPQFLRLFSDAGTSKGWLQTDAFSGHVYKWVKQDGSWVYVKITFKSSQGVANYTAAEQAQIRNPGLASEELYDSIQAGQRPGWKVYAQVMTPQDAENFRYNVLDLTKEWREDLVPLNEIGKVELTQNPTNYFAEVEQAAFSPGAIIDGWEPSDDPVLQLRLFAYTDAQRYRLGANYQQIPVNCPFSAVANYQRDGASSYLGNQGNRPAFAASYGRLAVVPRAYNSDNHTVWKSGAIRYLSQVLLRSPIARPEEQSSILTLTLHVSSNFAEGLSAVKRSNVVQRVLQTIQQASPELAQRIHLAMTTNRQAFSKAGIHYTCTIFIKEKNKKLQEAESRMTKEECPTHDFQPSGSPSTVTLKLSIQLPSPDESEPGTKQESTLIEPIEESKNSHNVQLAELAKALGRMRNQTNLTLTALINSHGSLEIHKEKSLAASLARSAIGKLDSEQDGDEDDEDEDGDEVEEE
ncbi:hypothetical protein H4Q26_005697 [Puccinia striiformis f. sp. tritici PST-130]|nr:hypothetical protein H4Q26_005697 [Puccinia striiformis f. sp. tritici PST-130]